MKVTPSLWSD